MKNRVGRGTVCVTAVYRDRSGIEKEDQTNEGQLMATSEENARVRIGIGTTMNLGNYESARVDVVVELPCTKDTVDEALREAELLVQRKANEYLDRVNSKAAKAMREMFDGE